MSKAGRKKQSVIENPYVIPIIIELANSDSNSYKLSKILNKAQSTIFVHLNNLKN